VRVWHRRMPYGRRWNFDDILCHSFGGKLPEKKHSGKKCGQTDKLNATRGVQEVLQRDHEEEWKCYKLHCIFQYNHHWTEFNAFPTFFSQTVNSTKTEIFCLSLQPATPWQLPWALHRQDSGQHEGETSDCISWILVVDDFNWISVYNTITI